MIYLKLAINSLKKNLAVVLPFLCSMIFLISLNTVLYLLLVNPGMDKMPGASDVRMIFSFGRNILLIFSLIFAYYTHSFLIKERQKEFGLYNLLGLSIKQLRYVLMFEKLILAFASLIGGLFMGIYLSNLMFLVLKKMMGVGQDFFFHVEGSVILKISLLVALLFVMLLMIDSLKLRKISPIDLFSQAKQNQSSPKRHQLLGVIGILLLGIAYYLSVTIQSPLQAFFMFFIAVLLVVIATYLLFTSTSVWLLNQLKQKRELYYQPEMFIMISTMIKRLWQNAMGLANISLLSTMVLVTVVTTASLYFGIDSMIRNRSPEDISLELPTVSSEDFDKLHQLANNHDITIDSIKSYRSTKRLLVTINEKGVQPVHANGLGVYDQSNAWQLTLMTATDYQKIAKEKIDLKTNQVAILSDNQIFNRAEFKVGQQHYEVLTLASKELPSTSGGALININDSVFDNVVMVLSSEKQVTNSYKELLPSDSDESDRQLSQPIMREYIGFNFEGKEDQRLMFAQGVKTFFDGRSLSFSSYDFNKKEALSFTGGFLFIGLIFGILFCLATALIIYYKQITEGRQDRRQFDVLQKIGMGESEVKATINQQMLGIFFFPIGLAILHLSFAMPMINKLLRLFSLKDVGLTIKVAVVTCVVFLAIYYVIFKLTSRKYYQIVRRGK
ncbi:FtsX-like permease family protein [Vagococcus zengguangii]|uniref:ABC transporter permease n=1 Tax=Vagococcus zengguangii TaxID=2571750 RepID=A0A4D7CUY2_9ENTE|nr:ABC transporter permease [Vagococcus zengguangii]QCI86912.1 ABC transporter permease [Vagococcus zengguangii]TLG80510.1 ABC transporter permease [Vagococcus zengguangii]